MSTDLPPPPVVPQVPYVHVEQGIERPDPYHWMKDREDPRLIPHLEAENAYTTAVMESSADLVEVLYRELIGRIEESTVSAPWNQGAWTYRSRIEAGQQYAIYERKPQSGEHSWQVFFDANKEALGKEYFDLGFLDISPNGQLLAYAVDLEGDESYTLQFRDLETGKNLPDRIEEISGNGEWNASGQDYFYIREDDTRRPFQIFRHTLGKPEPTQPVHEEKDPLFYLSIEKSQDQQYLFAVSESQETTEVLYLNARSETSTFAATFGRQTGHQYSLDHYDGHWIVRTNQNAPDFQLLSLPIGASDFSKATILVPPDPSVRLEGMVVLKEHLILLERTLGLDRIRYREWKENAFKTVPTTDSVYDIEPGHNAEFAVTYLDIEYSSPIRPAQTLRIDLETGSATLLKQQKIPSGHDPDQYKVRRVHVPSHDGVEVPMTILQRKDLDPDLPHPVYLYGYGAYGSPVFTGFRASWLTWLQRGFIVAIAHVRGGGLLGEQWYQDGKLEKKENSFRDCLACAHYLIHNNQTQRGKIALHGGSAGGLLVGAVLNADPSLFGAVVAEVPFVDVLNTMLDPSLPLTQFEYEEWGNPEDPEVFARIRQYAPYESIQQQTYPPILATAGLNDPRVPYWEAAKWVAKLRDNQSGRAPILLKTDLQSGHGGPSGRYNEFKELAFVQSFVLQHIHPGHP